MSTPGYGQSARKKKPKNFGKAPARDAAEGPYNPSKSVPPYTSHAARSGAAVQPVSASYNSSPSRPSGASSPARDGSTSGGGGHVVRPSDASVGSARSRSSAHGSKTTPPSSVSSSARGGTASVRSAGGGTPVPRAPPTTSQDNLREIVKKRVLDDVFHNTCAKWSGWMVVVVDDPGMRTLSSVMGMYDLMENRVTIVENLSKKRAPFHDMAGVYLCAPTERSINKILADYASPNGEKKNPLYGGPAFLYFLRRVPDKYLNKIKQCRPLLRRIKALGEVNVDFLARESRAFHFDMHSCFSKVFQPRQSPSRVDLQIVDKLVTLCATMNEYPHIRYPANSTICTNMAMAFHEKMNTYVGRSPNWWYHGGGERTDRDRSTLLFLDRSIDVLSPLMHEFTYQAMVNDLLPIDDDRIKYSSETGGQDDGGGSSEKEVLLNDNDELWVELKGKHIADVIQILSARIKEIVGSSGAQLAKDSGKSMSLTEMASALKALPEYKEVMSKLSQHMHIAHQCMAVFNKEGLLDLGELEQSLATGVTDEGRNVKLTDLVKQAEDILPPMSEGQAMRLLAIFIVSQNGLPPSEKDRLFDSVQLEEEQMKTLKNLQTLGIPLDQEQVEKPKHHGVSKLFGGHHKVQTNSRHNTDSEYSSSRYVCKLKEIMEQMGSDDLSIEEYPSVLPLPPSGSGTATSVRTARSARPGASRFGGAEKKKANFVGGRQMVFIAGGMCFSEIRAAEELMEGGEKEFIVGSTSFVTPTQFLRDLGTLESQTS